MYKLSALTLMVAFACSGISVAQPVRSYDDKGAPPFKVLKEGENPPLDACDNFVIGPKYVSAPERKVVDGVPHWQRPGAVPPARSGMGLERLLAEGREVAIHRAPGRPRNNAFACEPNRR